MDSMPRPDNGMAHNTRIHGLPVVIVHRSADDNDDRTPLLFEADDERLGNDEEFSTNRGNHDSPMPRSPASSRSSQDTQSLSSLESEDDECAASPETVLSVGSAPEPRSPSWDTKDKQFSQITTIPMPRSKQVCPELNDIASASSVPVGSKGEKLKRDKSHGDLKHARIPKLKSILKRRQSDPAKMHRVSTATLPKDGRPTAREKTETASPLVQSEDSRRVFLTLPEGYNESRQTSPNRGFVFRVYATRFYVLFLFCAFGFIYGVLWNSLGPVAKTAEVIYQFNNGDIALIANWGPIAFTLSLVFYTLIIQRRGLRWACLSSVTIMFLGAGLRCMVAVQRSYAAWFLHAGYVCIGLARFVAQVAPPVLSATWFKAGQRTTATATAVMMPQLGMSLFAAVEPYIIEELNVTTTPAPDDISNNSSEAQGDLGYNPEKVDKIFNEMMEYMYIQLFLAAGICAAMWIFFPARPPSPPTKSASVMYMTLRRGFRMAGRNTNFWFVAIPANAVVGVLVGWISMLELNLKQVHAGQCICGWLIFGNGFGGLIAGLLIARASDRKASRMKPLLLTLMCCGFIAILMFTLQVNDIIPSMDETISGACVLVGVFLYATLPLICEISAELAYPVQEHVALVINIIVMNLATFLYLLPPLFPQVGVIWLNWTFLGVTGAALPFIACYKQKYTRAEHDKYLTDEGYGTHKVDEWLRKEHVGSDEDDPLASDMNWVDDTSMARRSSASSGTILSIQEDSPLLRRFQDNETSQGHISTPNTSVIV